MIVGLHGRGRAGNMEAAKYLVEYHGFTRYSFADPIRDLLLRINPTIPVYNESLKNLVGEHGWDRIRNNPSVGPVVRRMLNETGAGLRDKFGKDVLLNLFDTWMTDEFGVMGRTTARVVVVDVNLDSEALWLAERGGLVVAMSKDVKIIATDDTDRGLSPRLIDHVVSVASTDRPLDIGRNVALRLGLEKAPSRSDTSLRSVPN